MAILDTEIPDPEIPILPVRPRVHPIADKISRSYSVGRDNFLRACDGEVLKLSIATGEPVAADVRARLVATVNPNDGNSWINVPFDRQDERTFVCRVKPKNPGLHSFRAEFSVDGGSTWLRDTVPDTWIWIDPPQVDALRMYTLIPDVSGTIADWKADLKRISGMGFNAIHLLPITAMDKSLSPYSARDLFAIDPSYLVSGSGEDAQRQLEDFVAECARIGIRLVFDLVLNHVGVQSEMARRAPDWIVPDQNEPDGLKRARYWSDQGWRNWDDLVLINYEHPSEAIRSEIWSYMSDYALFWAKYANQTGGLVRFDNLHSSDPDFVGALTASLHREYPQVGIIAEYFTDENTLLRTSSEWGLSLNLATPWNAKFVPQLRGYLQYIHRISAHIRYIMPITSHDSGSPAQEFGTADSTIPRYVAAALMGTGATGMPQGVEFGEHERINFIGRQPKMSYPSEPRFSGFIARVNSILQEYAAFRCGENCRFVDDGHPSIIAVFRKDGGAHALGFLVVCNFDIQNAQRISIELASVLNIGGPVKCSELLTGETRVVSLPSLQVTLPPCGAQVIKLCKD
jgi:hypothetical protein